MVITTFSQCLRLRHRDQQGGQLEIYTVSSSQALLPLKPLIARELTHENFRILQLWLEYTRTKEATDLWLKHTSKIPWILLCLELVVQRYPDTNVRGLFKELNTVGCLVPLQQLN